MYFIPLVLIWKKRTSVFTFCENNENGKLPIYTKEEVAEHNSSASRIWVSYQRKVYDITDFIENHPGGRIILQAAGKPLESFFRVYTFHKKFNIYDFIDQYLIGDLKEGDWYENNKYPEELADHFENDPIRDPMFIVHSSKPFNAETPLELLIEGFVTPNNLFFVRNHFPVPPLDPKMYTLTICFQKEFIKPDPSRRYDYYYSSTFKHHGEMEECLCHTIPLFELKNSFKEHDVMATMQCSGNRRKEMNKQKSVQGLGWEGGAIGNAVWTGVRVKDVLRECGLIDHEESILAHGHLHCIGNDNNPSTKEYYETSVPLSSALDPSTLLAFNMNSVAIPADHGFPLRFIIPGITGARNVKWLKKLIVSDEESNSRWQMDDYRCYSPDKSIGSTIKKIDVPAIHQTPVTSLICKPSNGSSIRVFKNREGQNQIEVEGLAYSGGGRGISRVELSIDNGENWIPASLTDLDQTLPHRVYSWTFWKALIPVSYDVKEVNLICKAVDSSYNHQPESPLPIWNMRGLLNNSWHRIHFNILEQ